MNSTVVPVPSARSGERSKYRSKTASTKLTEQEFAKLEGCARASGKNLSEWCREVLLKHARVQPSSHSDPFVLSEVLGLRTIVINLFAAVVQGETITWERVEQITKNADAVKLEHALERIAKAESSELRTKI
jgi:hypothetical protein